MAPLFVASVLDKAGWSASHPGRSIPGETASGTHWIGGWVGPRAVLDVVENSIPCPYWESDPGCTARSRLSYPSYKENKHL
jgi:hypothetical protein